MQAVGFKGIRVIPSKVVCVGRNYLGHIHELNNAVPEQTVIFIKPNSAISESVLIDHDRTLHYEAELGFLVVAGQLQGVGFGLDLTDRALQSELKAKGLPWERAKAFDGAAVFSGFVPFEGDSSKLSLALLINDKLVQQGSVTEMMLSPELLLDEASTFLSFEDNDILMTGTPEGVGKITMGDRFIGRVYLDGQVLIEHQWIVAYKEQSVRLFEC